MKQLRWTALLPRAYALTRTCHSSRGLLPYHPPALPHRALASSTQSHSLVRPDSLQPAAMARTPTSTASGSSLSPPPVTAEDQPAKAKKRKANTTPKTTTVKRARKKNDEDIPPLEQRTGDSKLRVGAHVSTAGGINQPHHHVHFMAEHWLTVPTI
jgi:hypothetical protein